MPEDLDALDRGARNLVHVDQALFFLLHQILHRLVDAHLSLLGAALKEIAQHVFHVDAHLFDALRAGQFDHRKILFADFDFDQAIIELAAAQLRAQLFARASETARRVLDASSLSRCVLQLVVGIEIVNNSDVERGGGNSISRIRSSTFSSAFSAISSIFSCRVMSTEISVRSRIMLSTSRPT